MRCASSSKTASVPGEACTAIPVMFAIEPDGKNSAASLPSILATRSSRRRTVGSPSSTSSPTSALAIAWRIAALGLVTVSERMSIGTGKTGRGEDRKRGSTKDTPNLSRCALQRRPLFLPFFPSASRSGLLRHLDRGNRDFSLLGSNNGLLNDDSVRLRANDRRVDRVLLGPDVNAGRGHGVRVQSDGGRFDLVRVVAGLLARCEWQCEHRGAEEHL